MNSVSESTTPADGPLPPEELYRIDAYWRAANYLSVGQIYLLDNPLLREPLERKHVKPRLLGHWGTTPGLNLAYVHLNRVIKRDDLNVLYVTGPGHGGPGLVANVYLEGVYTEVYPHITRDAAGMKKLFKQFSFPGGIPSHVAPETPGSIHEGGELGYALSHAFGAAFDNPDLIVACVVGDGEAETGPLATSWHSNKFLNPARDGAVLPILHLNGYKIANPTVLAKLPHDELVAFFHGHGYEPHFVEGSDPLPVHQRMAEVMDTCVARIRDIWKQARNGGPVSRPIWPVIVLRTPKGWTTHPPVIDGKVVEGSWRSHQVPMGDMDQEGHVRILEQWLKSYRPEELFDDRGAFKPELAALAPAGNRRMGANPHANGGHLMKPLEMPDFRKYAVAAPTPGGATAEATRVQGTFIRDVMKLNMPAANFRVFSPDENASNRWGDVFTVTGRCLVAPVGPNDTSVSADGRVMEVLSEHQCQGWLEGYLLTGRHGFFNCYEAFIHIIDSMFNQHAKWLKVCNHIPWRKPIPSLNYLLTSHVWRQDHNGFSHQDPGFIDHVVNKKAEIIRVYLPPDANTLLWVTDHVLRTWNRINVVVAGKQPAPVWLTVDEAAKHCEAGLGVWEWASTDGGNLPHVILACCGDVPTLETLAAVTLLRELLPAVRVRVVNVVNLMKLQDRKEHPHGLTDAEFDAVFGTDTPVIFNFHGYPWLIHRLCYRRKCHPHLHVRGYKEEGTTTTPFDMCVLNDIDRFKLVKDVIDRVPGLAATAGGVRELMVQKRAEHKAYIAEHGDDLPEIRNWVWPANRPNAGVTTDARGTDV
ncbi:MAG: phosphoketolase [Mycobacterium sp.]|nr:MAG: phosphoketolase [Mycobacterium sp.]